MRISRAAPASLIGALALAGLLLTGCAGGTGADQSRADACTILERGMESLQSDLASNMAKFGTDPRAAADAIAKVAGVFSDNVDKISSTEVKPAADKANDALGAMVDQFSAYAEDPAGADPEKLMSSSTAVEATFGELGTICS